MNKKVKDIILILIYIIFALYIMQLIGDQSFIYFVIMVPMLTLSYYIFLKYIQKRDKKQAMNIATLLSTFKEDEFSPAVVAKLYVKDCNYHNILISNILNMAAKDNIKITYNNKEVKSITRGTNKYSMTADELYIYNSLIDKKNDFDYQEWILLVDKLSKNNSGVKEKRMLLSELVSFIFIICSFVFIFLNVFNQYIIVSRLLKIILGFIYILSAIIMGTLFIVMIVVKITDKEGTYITFNTYNKEGNKQLDKWSDIKHFLNIFIKMEDKDIKSKNEAFRVMAYSSVFNLPLCNKKVVFDNEEINCDLFSSLNEYLYNMLIK